MTGPASSSQTPNDRSVFRAIVDNTLGDPVAIVAGTLVLLAGVPTTVFAMQTVLWDALRTDLNEAVAVDTVVAVTPFDVIFLQVRVALLVGFVLALETVVLRRWWTRSSLPSRGRLLRALVGAALFPIGAILGYEYVFPVVFEMIAAGGSSWSIVRLAGLACYVSLAAGVAAQVAFAKGTPVLFQSRHNGASDGRS